MLKNRLSMRRMAVALTAMLSVSFAGLANASVPNGAWSGLIDVGSAKLAIVLNFSDDGSCTLDSPDQGAKGIPATVGLLTADSVSVSIPAIGASFAGKVGEDTIDGIFSQSGYRFPLVLNPGAVVRNRPQTPKQPYPYVTEDVVFENPDGKASLSGTLTYPLLYAKRGKETPVVLLVSGSGLQDRDEEIFGHKPFAVIADYLAMRGIASLRFDDRSIGKSTGDVANATTATFAGDAESGVEYLRRCGRFGKVGIIGHSEGGTIGFMLGAEKKVDFVVSLAGVAIPGDSVLLLQNRALLSGAGLPQLVVDGYCSALSSLFAKFKKGDKIGNPQSEVDSILKSGNIALPGELEKNLVALIDSWNPWLDYFIACNPKEYISKVGCPVFALNGSLDTQVFPMANLSSLKSFLPVNAKTQVKKYPGLNHLFQHCKTGRVDEYGTIEETMSPEVLRDIADWINSL